MCRMSLKHGRAQESDWCRGPAGFKNKVPEAPFITMILFVPMPFGAPHARNVNFFPRLTKTKTKIKGSERRGGTEKRARMVG